MSDLATISKFCAGYSIVGALFMVSRAESEKMLGLVYASIQVLEQSIQVAYKYCFFLLLLCVCLRSN